MSHKRTQPLRKPLVFEVPRPIKRMKSSLCDLRRVPHIVKNSRSRQQLPFRFRNDPSRHPSPLSNPLHMRPPPRQRQGKPTFSHRGGPRDQIHTHTLGRPFALQHYDGTQPAALPNSALRDQGAPPAATRSQSRPTSAPTPASRHAGLPLRSARRPRAESVHVAGKATRHTDPNCPQATSSHQAPDDRAVTQLPALGTAIGCRDGFAILPTGRAHTGPIQPRARTAAKTSSSSKPSHLRGAP